MPSLDGDATAGYSGAGNMSAVNVAPAVEASFLCEALRQARGPDDILVLDCRGADDYGACHIRSALSVGLPSLMLRRLTSGKLSLHQVVRHLAADGGDRLARLHQCVPIVLYDHAHASSPNTPTLMTILCKKFNQEGCDAHCLAGGFEEFRSRFPEWCESSLHAEPPIVGLKSLRITCLEAEEEGVEGACDSSLGRDTPLDDLGFPVEILPHLYLGNAQNSGDRDALNRHKIRYIINVTPNLPNVFDECGSFKYMKIPIADHWSQNLASFFPKAIQFIDEARESGVGVLVHCLAGISRSVTITVAYLMYKEKLNLEEAYEYVRVKKANIAPNFNFMGQLQDFQQQLNLSPHKCQCVDTCRCRHLHFLTPARTSPDSGIEFDRFS
ncbi:dual specificity protein phosphatase 7-like isoform X2 [Eriocheir sinensis]|uniref:dual specificity protein phosphatase 7-like isoform X1 n=1 Tax=Eriocheir sinensis TaxID=95602 RepID=UPI0021C74ABD|nr:dual specificity protein phosphatase 7-like isoform X1 [Eriocheir sinensis]XP_050733105.1 dual specificity protein phosphatase 7-like isoform X2 [Eriocheir sinensis]